MTEWVHLRARGREERLEFARVTPRGGQGEAKAAPTLVFLHEGLGSVTLWRDFPQRLCDLLNVPGLVYSRYGYGRSTPRPRHEPLPADYLEQEAEMIVPALLEAISCPSPWLIGHSDGGSIALLAAAGATPVSGIAVIAPHWFVEEKCLSGIERARQAFEHGALRAKMGKYHQDADAVFYGWHDVWAHSERRDWSIAPALARLRCPVLALQGREDEYATLEQIEGVQRYAPHCVLKVIENCGHFPHLTRAEETGAAIADFIRQNRGGASS
ncbi:MAG: alpha/beta hydrolase [Zoogloeaceae bacterium]|jgi:pimeloyl-ACP methyl ester carboxylesterase|nr:alpha/beta hydrolase [Zoogloeaceae bacterium]